MPRRTWSAGSAPAGLGNPTARVRPAENGIFRKDGEFWTVAYGNKLFRLKDTKGFVYLAHLLRHPETEFHVLDLVGGLASPGENDETRKAARGGARSDQHLDSAGLHVANLGDAGEMLDDRAKVAYRRRLAELQENLEEAKKLGNGERAEQVEPEIDALTSELSRAVGLGGRSRRAASAAERARQSVTKTIKTLVERIAHTDAALGKFFTGSIRTGTFCSYHPNPDFPIAWTFGAPDADVNAAAEEQVAPGSDAARSHLDASPAPLGLPDASPFFHGERSVFAGRESEYGTIAAAIDSARNSHGSVIMLGGEPGVGKTRLAMEMAEHATRNGFRCFVGHCYERDEPFPYLPFVEILESTFAQAPSLADYRRLMGDNAGELAQLAPSLRRLVPDIPQPVELPPQQRRRYLFQSVSEVLARTARVRPQLLVLEDLHWADESTLALLTHLAQRVADLPIVIVGTYRHGYGPDNPPLARTLEELIRMGIRPLKLQGLTRNAVAQMLQGLSLQRAPANLVSLIFEETQGNPFFVEEVYKHLIEERQVFDAAHQFRTDIKIDEIDVPENVRLVLDRRLERLDENDRLVLAAAAVTGRRFSFQLLRTMLEHTAVDDLFNVIEKAQQMGLLVSSSAGPEAPFTFAHDLMRQTLLAGISLPRRQHLHARVADAIERLDSAAVNERAGEIADHLLKAGAFAEHQKVASYLVLAGKAALKALAYADAHRNFESALAHHEDNRSARAEILAAMATADHGLGKLDEALLHWRDSSSRCVARWSSPTAHACRCCRPHPSIRYAWPVYRWRNSAWSTSYGVIGLSPWRRRKRCTPLPPSVRDRAAPGDRETARTYLREALSSYHHIGMPRHGELTQVLLEQTTAG